MNPQSDPAQTSPSEGLESLSPNSSNDVLEATPPPMAPPPDGSFGYSRISDPQPAGLPDDRRHLNRLIGIGTVFIILLIAAAGATRFFNPASTPTSSTSTTANLASNYTPVNLPNSLLSALAASPRNSAQAVLTINGQARITNGLALVPSAQPSAPQTGEFYYDQSINRPYYYNGSTYVSITQPSIGSGLQLSNNQLRATGVLGLLGTTDQILVSASTGTVTLSLPQSIGTGSAPTFAGLTLSSPLAVGSGGTGATTASGARSNLGAAASGANNDLTSTAALDTITPNGALTIGAASQPLLLQGNASSQIVASGGGFTTTLGFAAPTADVNLLVPALSAGTYDICTTVGNCAGSGGGITGAGTANTIAMFTGAGAIGDSIITQSGGTAIVGGTLAATNLTGNGTGVTNVDAITLQGNGAAYFTNASNISSGTIADARLSANVALLNASNNFTGVNLQHNGNSVCDSSNNCNYLTSGTANGLYIQLQGSTPGSAQTGNYNITGTGIAGTLQGTTSVLTPLLDAASAVALNIGTSNATAINLNQSTTIAAGKNLTYAGATGNFDQSASTGTFKTGTGAVSLNGATTVASNKPFTANGSALFQDATNSVAAFQVQNSAGVNVLSVDTSGSKTTLGKIAASGTVAAGSLVFADGTTDNFGATLNSTTLTANRAISLPNEAGTICLQNSANCGFASGSGSASYIQNQNSAQQAASNFWISGTGRADTSFTTPLLDTPTAVALNIGTTNATQINLNQNTVVASGKTLQVINHASIGSGVAPTAPDILAVDDTINPSANTHGIKDILRLNPSADDANYHTGAFIESQTITGNTHNFTGGLRGGTIFAQHNGSGTLSQAYGSEVSIQNTSTGSITDAEALKVDSPTNSGGGTITTNYGLKIDDQTAGGTNYAIYTGLGAVYHGDATTVKTSSATAFQVQNASASTVLDVDTTNGRVGIGNANPQYALDVSGDINTSGNIEIGGTIVITSARVLQNVTANTSILTSGTLSVARGGTGASSFTDGQILIGNSTGNTLTPATLTAGSNIGITNGHGSITISNTGGYSIQAAAANFNPSSGTTHYFGSDTFGNGPTTAQGNVRLYIPHSGTITSCYLQVWTTGTLGSSETSTISIRLNQTTDNVVSSSVKNDAISNQYSNTGLSIPVTAGDYIEMKWVEPTWTTTPTGVRISAVIWVNF
jgi:hypothetical protein